MDSLHKLEFNSQDMQIEPDGIVDCRPKINGKVLERRIPISEVTKAGGQKMKVLKTVLTSACERDCYYCPFRAGRNTKRATFKPDEMAEIYDRVYRAGAVEGLFLSSGIVGGGITTQDKILDVAEMLRKKYRYRGYMHLKVMPGVEKDQLIRAMQLANRVSVNLEAPNSSRLQQLAPKKVFIEELLQPLIWAENIRNTLDPIKTWSGRWASTVTQFVVGAVGESDLELLSTSEQLYSQLKLSRIYYSRFKPISDTPLEEQLEEDPRREFRLYQSSFLFRDYGFYLEEMPFDQNGNLPRDQDPKMAWAKANLSHSPVELNTASREELLRVPGIGPKGAETIVTARKTGMLTEPTQLKKLGVQVNRSLEFILLAGKRPSYQIALL